MDRDGDEDVGGGVWTAMSTSLGISKSHEMIEGGVEELCQGDGDRMFAEPEEDGNALKWTEAAAAAGRKDDRAPSSSTSSAMTRAAKRTHPPQTTTTTMMMMTTTTTRRIASRGAALRMAMDHPIMRSSDLPTFNGIVNVLRCLGFSHSMMPTTSTSAESSRRRLLPTRGSEINHRRC